MTKPAWNAIDLTAVRFGRLVVLSRAASCTGGARWNCLCDCGELTEVRASHLRGGKIKSCGCLRRESSSTRHAKRRADLAGQWERQCIGCKKTLPLTSFFARRTATLGVGSTCKECQRVKYLAKKVYVDVFGPRVSIAGRRYGRLLVLDEPAPRRLTKGTNYSWPCLCDCGDVTWVPSGKLRCGDTISCGCWGAEVRRAKAIKWPSGVTAKECSKCQRRLPVEKFWRDSSMAAGYSSHCKDCVRPVNRENSRAAVENLSDKYVALTLRVPLADTNHDLLALKREQLRLHRLARELKQAITHKEKANGN